MMKQLLTLKGLVYLAIAAFLLGVSPTYSAENSQSDERALLEEILVTGSFIKRTQQESIASPIDVINLKDLAAEAAFSISDLVLNLTTNSGAQNQSDGFNQTFSIGTTNVNLRGLGVSSTLTLLNGRRQTLSAATTLSGDQFVDLNSLVPTIAIDQVEVLQDGATALYGSDAVAGIANFKTRKHFEGVELDVSYATVADNQDDVQVSVIAGRDFGKVHGVVSVSFFDREGLSANDRRDDLPLRDAFSIFGQPGTYLVFPNQPGPPARTLDPACTAVAADDNDVSIIAAGPINPTCRFDFGDFFSLVAEEQRLQVYLDLTADITDSVEWFLEAGYANNEVVSTGSPSQPVLFPPSVPGGNPAVQALGGGSRLLAFHRVDGAGASASKIPFDYTTYRIATGLRGELSEKWSYEFALTSSQNNFDYLNSSDTLRDRYLAALGGTGGPNNDAFFNPLFGATNDPSVREDFRGIYSWEAESSLTTVDGFISGEVAQLPAGAVGLAVGAQYRKDKLSYTYSEAANSDNLYFFIGNRDFSGDQDVYAVFAEVDIPLAENFNVQAAIRYEDFGDDDSLDPKIGFLWRPGNNVSLRATYGTSFRAPSIFQRAGRFNVPARILDPTTDESVTVAQQTSADPDNPVEAQESDTFNLGVTWASDDAWRVSLDYWNFDYKNFITPENPTALVASDPNGPQTTRDPTTMDLLAVSTFFKNAGSLKTDGLDFLVSKEIATNAIGSLLFQLNLTYVLSYDLEDPVSGDIDGLGQRNFTNFGVPMPELRGNFRISWSKAGHGISAYLRYTDSYEDENNLDANKKPASVKGFTSVDLQYSWDVSFGRDAGPTLSIGAKNIFDELPPDVSSRTGYDALTHNPRGRQIYASVRVAF